MQPKRRFPRIVLPIAVGFVAAALLWSGVRRARPREVSDRPGRDPALRRHVHPVRRPGDGGSARDAASRCRSTSSATSARSATRAARRASWSRRPSRRRAGDIVDATQTNVYVMDRRTLQNVADDRAYAFDPSNVVDRSGAYRLNLPFDTSSDSTYDDLQERDRHDLRDARRHDDADHRRGRPAPAQLHRLGDARCPSTTPTWPSSTRSCRCPSR